MTEVVNNQDKIKIDIGLIARFADNVVEVVKEAGKKKPLIAFIDDSEMAGLNFEFRSKKGTTDVLSFAYDDEDFEINPSLGDVLISAEQASRQADEHGLELVAEIKQLVLHGVLHLCGFDHETDEGEMNKREIQIREVLGIA